MYYLQLIIDDRLGFNIEVDYVTITTINILTQLNHRPI